jgi:hypothetical protein
MIKVGDKVRLRDDFKYLETENLPEIYEVAEIYGDNFGDIALIESGGFGFYVAYLEVVE